MARRGLPEGPRRPPAPASRCASAGPRWRRTRRADSAGAIRTRLRRRQAFFYINIFNNIDLDKFDYLTRDSYSLGLTDNINFRRIIDNIIIDNNNNLAYAKHCSTEIYCIFHKRYMMHKKIYSHKTSKIIELMISDIIKLVDPIFNISKMIDNIGEFCKLTDNSIFFWLENAMSSLYFLNIQLDENNMDIIKKLI